MGLDIYHNRAIKERPENIEPWNEQSVLESEYLGFDVPIGYF